MSNPFDQLTVGMPVHYVHPNGTHSEARVLHIHNRETGVIDLFIRRDDHIKDNYTAPVVAYREVPTAYSWHFVEEQTDDSRKENVT